MDMEGEIISINEGDRTPSVFFGGADFKRMTKEEAEAILLPPKQEANLSSWNEIAALYKQRGLHAPRDKGEYGPGDDDCERAEEPPPRDSQSRRVLRFRLFQKDYTKTRQTIQNSDRLHKAPTDCTKPPKDYTKILNSR